MLNISEVLYLARKWKKTVWNIINILTSYIPVICENFIKIDQFLKELLITHNDKNERITIKTSTHQNLCKPIFEMF